MVLFNQTYHQILLALVYLRFCQQYSVLILIFCPVDNWMNYMGIQTDNQSRNKIQMIHIWRKIFLTWQGHWSYWSLNEVTHDCSHDWLFLQSMMHWPRLILLSFKHCFRLSLFWDVGFSPQTQIGFEQPLHPSGQLLLHGQSLRQSLRTLPHSLRQLEFWQDEVHPK